MSVWAALPILGLVNRTDACGRLLADLNKSVGYLVSLVEEEFKHVLDELGREFTQNGFALKVEATRVPGALFAVRSGKCKSIRVYILSMFADKLKTLIYGTLTAEEA